MNEDTTLSPGRNGLTRGTLLRRAGIAAGALGVVGLAGCGDSEGPGNQAALLSSDYRAEWPDAELDLAEGFGREITMMTGIPDTHFGIDATTVTADGRVLVEATVTGTHTGVLELPHGVMLEPTGRSLSLSFVFLMRFADGLLVHERLFFDHHELIHQLTVDG